MKHLAQKIILSILVFLTIFVSFAPYSAAKAQTWYNSNPLEWYLKVYDEDMSPPTDIFGERYTAAQVQWVLWSVFSNLINLPFTMLGMSPTPTVCFAKMTQKMVEPIECLTASINFINAVGDKLHAYQINNPEPLAVNKDKFYVWKKVFLEDRPLSGLSYVRNIGRKLKIIPEANAAETYGYNRLASVAPLWTIFRNISYFFFVVALILMSFMIMFKVKISPQAVISIQYVIPKIIITLLLVTFSFAIAGFMIDLVYLVMGLFATFFPMGSAASTYTFLNGWTGDGFLAILIYSIIYIVLYIIFTIIIAIMAITTLDITALIFGLILLVFVLVVVAILLIWLFLTLFNLFKALASFYLAVITGPLQISMGIFPNSKGFSGWIKSMIAPLSVFPATGILWFFAFMFLFAAPNAAINCVSLRFDPAGTIAAAASLLTSTGAPPDLVTQFTSIAPLGKCWDPPLLGVGATSIAFLLISLMCIMVITKVQKVVKGALEGRAFDLEGAIGEDVKKGASTVGSYVEGKGKDLGRGSLEALGKIIQTASR